MAKKTKVVSFEEQPLTSDEVARALSYHGAFLKKHTLAAMRENGLRIENEEQASDFGGKTRAADIIAVDINEVTYVVECKKVSAEKAWVFIKGLDRRYRVCRWFRVGDGRRSATSTFAIDSPLSSPICSEGYEYRRVDPVQAHKSADQSPIFDAGTQIAAAYLGVVQKRFAELDSLLVPTPEFYVPLLVTNARLYLINADDVKLDLETGELLETPKLIPVDHVILKQPIASPANFPDFRIGIQTEEFNQRLSESIYVVNAGAIATFLSQENKRLRAAQE
jgi:hypothetical protein